MNDLICLNPSCQNPNDYTMESYTNKVNHTCDNVMFIKSGSVMIREDGIKQINSFFQEFINKAVTGLELGEDTEPEEPKETIVSMDCLNPDCKNPDKVVQLDEKGDMFSAFHICFSGDSFMTQASWCNSASEAVKRWNSKQWGYEPKLAEDWADDC